MNTTAPTNEAAAPEAQPTGKGKLAMYWAASCGGCEIALLGIDEKILDVGKAFDIVLCPCISDGKVRDIERMEDGEIDVCMFNGGIRTSEQEYMARLLRQKSKVLIDRQILLLGLLASSQHGTDSRGIHCDRLFCKYMFPRIDTCFQMNRPEVRRRGQQHDIHAGLDRSRLECWHWRVPRQFPWP